MGRRGVGPNHTPVLTQAEAACISRLARLNAMESYVCDFHRRDEVRSRECTHVLPQILGVAKTKASGMIAEANSKVLASSIWKLHVRPFAADGLYCEGL